MRNSKVVFLGIIVDINQSIAEKVFLVDSISVVFVVFVRKMAFLGFWNYWRNKVKFVNTDSLDWDLKITKRNTVAHGLELNLLSVLSSSTLIDLTLSMWKFCEVRLNLSAHFFMCFTLKKSAILLQNRWLQGYNFARYFQIENAFLSTILSFFFK